ncbi:MAG: leucine-rich repeat protein, partial [Oscillospiraceae bacterium]|nr:leucine-rich repeat protein [Oscillospiraceae bacterium]
MKLKRILSLILCLVMLFSLMPSAYAANKIVASGSCGDGLSWQLDDKGALAIYGTGAMYNYDFLNQAPWQIHAEKIKNIDVYSGVSSIGDYAFYDCEKLESVTLSNTIDTIGSYAFRGCSSLKGIDLPYGITVVGDGAFYGCSSIELITIPGSITAIGNGIFYGCSSLAGVYIPGSVTTIGDDAFYGCKSLTGISIPATVTAIGGGAFNGCSSLNNVVIPGGVAVIGGYAFSNCLTLSNITIPESVTAIGEYAFSGCISLKTIDIPDAVTEIGKYAFSGCRRLDGVIIPNGVTGLGDGAFNGCSALRSIVIPESITAIANNTFSGCGSLTSVGIPESVTAIGTGAFSGCSSLRGITIPNSVTSIGERAFSECTGLISFIIPESITAIANGTFSGCNSLVAVHIPESVTSIGGSAFSGCGSLGNILIPGSVITIGASAFSGCGSLGSVIIPDSVTTVGASAFNGCLSLKSVTIPNSVTFIGDSAFSDCVSLEAIAIPDSITSIADSTFYGCRALKSVAIPDTVTSIGASAFASCRALKYIFIPESVTSIGFGAFSNCVKLESFVIPGKVTVIADNTFSGCSVLSDVTIPNSVTAIGNYAFSGCRALAGIIIPNSVVTIGDFAFNGCTILENIELPDSVTTVGESAFSSCRALESVIIPNSVTAIGNNAFSGCISLGSVIIPNSVTAVGSGTFNGCVSLSDVTIPDSVSTIGDNAFRDCSAISIISLPNSITAIGSYAFCDCSALGSIIIPEGVSTIGEYAFYGCSSLASAALPNSITEIGDYVFARCSVLDGIVIPGSVTTIGNSAFYDCASLSGIDIPKGVKGIFGYAFSACIKLENIVIPDGVAYVGVGAFSGCAKLSEIKFKGIAPTIDEDAFYGVNAKVYYPVDEAISWYGVITDNYGGNITWIAKEHEHSYEAVVAEPTCTEGGYTTYTCVDCGFVYVGDEVSPLGHDEAIDEAVAPTCIETGLAEGAHCARCGIVLSSQEIVPVSDHIWDEGVVSRANDVCVEGEMLFRCTYCGAERREIIPALEGVISGTCGKNVKWELNSNGLLTISGEGAMYDFDQINLPGWMQHSNYIVDITEVIIEDGVTYIGKNTFNGLGISQHQTIKRVSIADSVSAIGEGAFAYCSALADVNIPEGITAIERSVFYATGLQNPIIPNTVVSIEEYAFGMCSFTSIEIPASVKRIAKKAFSEDASLKEVHMKGVVAPEIEEDAFSAVDGATVYYLKAHESWNDIIDKDYGGELIWVGIKHDHSFVGGVCSTCEYSVLGEEWIAPNFAEGDYTMIAIGDTQNMVKYWPENYKAQMQWIADNKESMNIQAVLHMGDMVQDDDAAQWAVAKSGTDILDEAGVVWMPMRGNHDNSDMFNSTYPFATYGARGDFGGSYDGKTLDHYYCVITVGQREYVIINLGWMPTVLVLDWAKKIVEENSDKNVIISCHAYMNKDGTPLSWGTDISDGIKNEILANLPDGMTLEKAMEFIPDGDAIWAAFKDYENVVLALSGHVNSADVVTFTDTNGAGRNVSSLLVDRQSDDAAQPLGMLAVLTFNANGDKVSVNWYSAEYDAFYKESNQFEISVPHVVEDGGHVHEYTTESVVAPTCTEKGYTEHKCVCGDSEKDNFVDALGHKWDGGVNSANNTRTYTCDVCGYKETIPAAEDVHRHNYSSELIAPTCGAMGYTKHTCIFCGDVKMDTYVDSLEHVWSEGKVTVEATEESEGLLVYTCTLCGEEKEEVIPRVQHIHVYSDTVVAPACEVEGYTEHTCRCGDSYRDATVEALAHKWSEGVVTKEATKDEEGQITYTCSICGGEKYESIAKLPDDCLRGHKWDKGTVSVEATDEAEGEMLYTCTSCGETKTEVIEKLPNVKDFKDVVTGDYFYTPVKWALAEGITKGTEGDKFSPAEACTRAQVVTFLWRAAGEPVPTSTETPFTDIKKGEYYYDAVLWAVE